MVLSGNLYDIQVPVSREREPVYYTGSRGQKSRFLRNPSKKYENKNTDTRISRGIQWKPPRGPELGQIQNFQKTGSSNPFVAVPKPRVARGIFFRILA